MNEENRVPSDKAYDGPCRETAKSLLERLIANKRRELVGLVALLGIATQAKPGSPLEESLWEMFSRFNRGSF